MMEDTSTPDEGLDPNDRDSGVSMWIIEKLKQLIGTEENTEENTEVNTEEELPEPSE